MGELIKAAEQFGREEFSVADLMRKTHWGKSKTYAVLNRAEELGNSSEGERRGQYRLLHLGVDRKLAHHSTSTMFSIEGYSPLTTCAKSAAKGEQTTPVRTTNISATPPVLSGMAGMLSGAGSRRTLSPWCQ